MPNIVPKCYPHVDRLGRFRVVACGLNPNDRVLQLNSVVNDIPSKKYDQRLLSCPVNEKIIQGRVIFGSIKTTGSGLSQIDKISAIKHSKKDFKFAEPKSVELNEKDKISQ